MNGYLDLLRALMDLDPPLHIFGGIAEDALLHGRFSRPHEDVDVLVYREELDARVEQAHALGFHAFHVRMMPRPGRPLVVGAIAGGLNLEYVVFDRTPEGRVSFDIPVPAGMRRVWLPEGAFDHPPSEVEGVQVRTLSPLALYQIRAAVAETFGGFRPKDRVTQAALRRRFFAGVEEAKLAPEVELLREGPMPRPAGRARRPA